ncbi:unnamed protein product [Clonostachys byssicola]|uniref:Uncharacterized protein n=1 Tax=Clonostachys byssicola TaxID=160290 RepID=A0A9N9UP85_9HYPO|nr:unnamed protein product [Clonostachys byssicola]
MHREWEVTPDDKNPAPDHPENYVFGHHGTSESLSRAIFDGCTICKHIKAAVIVEESESLSLNIFVSPNTTNLDTFLSSVSKSNRAGYMCLQSSRAPLTHPSVIFILLSSANARRRPSR